MKLVQHRHTAGKALCLAFLRRELLQLPFDLLVMVELTRQNQPEVEEDGPVPDYRRWRDVAGGDFILS
jgi:hypothetical protein